LKSMKRATRIQISIFTCGNCKVKLDSKDQTGKQKCSKNCGW
jgi:hypothetical protein